MKAKNESATADLVQRLLTPQEIDSVGGAHYTKHYMSGDPYRQTYHRVDHQMVGSYHQTYEQQRYKQTTQEN